MKNEIKYYFTQNLDGEIKTQVLEFIQTNQYGYIEQNPDWCRINNPRKKITFFYAIENEKVVCFCNIIENRFTAQIHLGPVCRDKDLLIESIGAIRKYYLKEGKAQLEIQLGILTGQETDYIEYELYKKLPFVQRFDTGNWSSIVINLNQSAEDIFNNFKKNHKGSIKKAIKENLYTKTLDDISEIKQLSEIYDKMYEARKIKKSFDNTQETFKQLHTLFLEQNNGMILGVFNQEDQMLGGVILGICNGEVYYKYGASGPEFRKFPILHLALYEGIKISIKERLSTFNFGGYNHFVKESDQVAAINFFKRSFNGDFIFYPKRMYFKLNKVKLCCYKILKKIYFFISSLKK